MKYPISVTELVDMIDDDEHATMLVIDAIESHAFPNLEITDETARDEILIRVTTWEHYDQYSQLIQNQKTFLRQPLPANKSISELNGADLLASNALASNTITTLKTDARTKRIYSSISVAASVLVITIGLFAITTNKETEPTQTKTASRSSASLNDAGATAESNNGSDQSLIVPDSQNDGLVTAKPTSKSNVKGHVDSAYDLGTFVSTTSLIKYIKSNDFNDDLESAQSQSNRTYDTATSSDFTNCSALKDASVDSLIFAALIDSTNSRVFAVTSNPYDPTVNFVVYSDCEIIETFSITS